MKIGVKLRKLREFYDYSQDFIASELDVSVSQYSKYERNETPITVNRLEQIAAVYKLSIADVISFDDKNVFNFINNKQANGTVNKQINSIDEPLKMLIQQLQNEIDFLKKQNTIFFDLIEKKNII